MDQMATSGPDQTPAADSRAALQLDVAALIVAALNLDVLPEAIGADEPLYGEGLGLDSIDILEVALEVSKRYGFQLRADNEDNVRIFRSLSSLTEHVAQHRTK
ncbi:MAG: phosphopantetheine-binding protein [Betaproteobacteria bacterium]